MTYLDSSIKSSFSLIFFLFFILICNSSFSQPDSTLKSIKLSDRFAFFNHLKQTKQYNMCLIEGQESFIKFKNQDTAIIMLAEAFRLNEKYSNAISLIDSVYSGKDFPFTNKIIIDEKIKNLLITEDLSNWISLLKNQNIFSQEKLELHYCSINFIRKNDLKIFYEKENSIKIGNCEQFKIKEKDYHFYNPTKSAIYSALLPGSGKVYTKQINDGIFSFAVSALNIFAISRAVNRFGVAHFYPVSLICLGSFFYLGNIYGSYKSAKSKNQKTKKRLIKDVYEVLYPEF